MKLNVRIDAQSIELRALAVEMSVSNVDNNSGVTRMKL